MPEGYVHAQIAQAAAAAVGWQIHCLPAYLAEQGIVGIEDIDVRALVACLREHPGSWAALSTETFDPEVLLARLTAAKGGESHA